MSLQPIENQLERMARELIAVAKVLDCSVSINVTKFDDGTFGGDAFKIAVSAADYEFHEDEDIDFTGLVEDQRHLLPLERQDEV